MNDKSTYIAEMPPENTMRVALAQRDASHDGAFVYGVMTTGVY
jgi:methylphosphotriester-DNA--protein-cysteine methyltransferase